MTADNRIKIYSTTTQSIELDLTSNEIKSSITSAAIQNHPKKQQRNLLVIGTEKGNIFVWDLVSGKLVHKLDQTKGK